MPFRFTPLEIADVILVEPRIFADDRGYFMETYKRTDFHAAGITESFVQDNHSLSSRGVIRGLHFQRAPKAQGKLVRVGAGRVLDIAVDIRPMSPTYLKWVGVELSSDVRNMLYIPAGFAHGFAALSDSASLSYKCTAEYDASLDAGIRWDDPDIALPWPFDDPIVSEKDKSLPSARDIKEL